MLRVHVVAPENIRIGNLMLDHRLERPAARQLLLDLEAADRADRKAKFGKTKATAELFRSEYTHRQPDAGSPPGTPRRPAVAARPGSRRPRRPQGQIRQDQGHRRALPI